MSTYLEALTVGEVDDETQIDIRSHVISMQYDLTSNQVSQLDLQLYDEDFRMHNSNYFMVGRRIGFNGVAFEIAAVSLSFGNISTVKVTARSQAMQEMRRDKRTQTWNKVSPSQVAADIGAALGMQLFIEPSPQVPTITKEKSENQEESSYDMLQRLARELEYLFFEAHNTLFFTSPEFLLDQQAAGGNQIELKVGAAETQSDKWPVSKISLRRTADGSAAATFSASLIKTVGSVSLFPGTVVVFSGASTFNQMRFILERVSFDATESGLVSISGSTPEDAEEMFCILQTFEPGSTGQCVGRIQQAVNANETNVWDADTTRQVASFQSLNGLPQDGTWGADDWAMIKGDYEKPPRPAGTKRRRRNPTDWSVIDFPPLDPAPPPPPPPYAPVPVALS